MGKNQWGFVAAMLFFITVAHVPAGICTENESRTAPAAVFPGKVFDFGLVLEGVEIKHDFVVQNRGASELLIQNVKPG